jgi:hypothetical protein
MNLHEQKQTTATIFQPNKKQNTKNPQTNKQKIR